MRTIHLCLRLAGCALAATAFTACGGGSSGSNEPPPAGPAETARALTVSWTAPEHSADGSPLTDLAGYRVLVGTASGEYTRTYTVDGTQTLDLTIPDLSAGTYYVVVKAYDTSNNESEPTEELVGVVQ